MEFNQEISKKDYKRAILKHYFAFGFTYINPVLGIILICIFLFTILSGAALEGKSFLFLIGGLFLLLRPWIYVTQIASVHRAGVMTIHVNEADEITFSQNGAASVSPIKDLYAFADRGEFVFLYFTKYRFHVIDKRQAGGDALRHLDGLLGKYEIMKKK